MAKQLPITNTIRRLRFDADEMTQQALAEKVGVTRQTILAIEAARYSPTLELAFKIAEVFGKELGEVFQYVPPSADDR
ncbi:helix-turn-helix transcriptional regulator [Pelagicoccus enzymogenes]|uniref:helix-turn-helix transcriptional regulator n=1 Tax=Pelagicoccus enzymogenes TaxID=2773457 RepID=UPI00281026B1|nr:helix-turn-helix transcriptional regulator [Pelagicoccus enzymogenes]